MPETDARPTPTTRVLLVDDHALFREGVALIAEHRLPAIHLALAGSVAQAREALRADAAIALVLLDLGLPDADGLDALDALRELAPALRIVVLSADDRAETVMAAIDRGAAGFIPKSADGGAFVDALRQVLDGRVYLPPQALLRAAPAPEDAVAAGEELGLSPRQLDVLRLVIEGRSNKLIMRELDLSESTVKTHLQAIFRRLGVGSRTQAVVAAARLGLTLGDASA